MYTITNLPKYLTQGNQGEKNVASFIFNFSTWKTAHPTGVITLHVIRPTETIADAYWPVSTTIDEEHNTLTWDVDDFDTQWPGNGSLSFIMTDVGNTFRLQSSTVTTVVIENLALYGTYPLPVILDATATATDILRNKTAYVNTGKATGTCTFDTDTSNGTVVDTDILSGKVAYSQSQEITGTLELTDLIDDATAAVTDILSPKTAYIATGKVTGTCTFDADTSSGDAVESDIALGKIAWVDGVELTGTSTKNADTTNATAVENSLLYGHTAYGADGTKLTGTGANWQYVKYADGLFSAATLTSVNLYMPNCISMVRSFYNNTVTQTATILFAANATLQQCFYIASAMTSITLNCSTSGVQVFTDTFRGCTSLTTINGAIDFTSATNVNNMFSASNNLQTITFSPGTLKLDLYLGTHAALTTASLLSIANGLNANVGPKTLTMHATSITNMNNINVDNVDGVAVPGNAMTLTQFINDIKGWTIA